MKFALEFILIAILVVFRNDSLGQEILNCPLYEGESILTQNENGTSSYKDPELLEFFKDLSNKKLINLERPILDVGAGYGGATHELIKAGAKNVYVNDEDQRNLICMQNFINMTFDTKKINLTYLPGDIVSNLVLSELPDKSFTLIFAQDVIHFFTYDQLISFIKMLNRKSSDHGIVVIFYSKDYIQQMDSMIYEIYKKHKLSSENSLDKLTEEIYKENSFPGYRHCSVKTYKNAPVNMRLPGFPCEIPVQGGGVGQLIVPEYLVDLMTSAGFRLIISRQYENAHQTQLLVFHKQQRVKDEEIAKNIEDIFKRNIYDAETNIV